MSLFSTSDSVLPFTGERMSHIVKYDRAKIV